MWQAVEGFSIILAVIFVFAIISLPRRASKRQPHAEVSIPKYLTTWQVPDNSPALEQAARGKAQPQPSLQPSEGQRVGPAPRHS
jgi:hypothetical protein